MAAAPEASNLFDQLALKRAGSRRKFGLRYIVDGAKRQRPEADFRAPPGERRRHNHDQVALFFEQERQRREAVKLRHVDVEDDDVGIAFFDLLDRLAPGPQACRHRHIGFGCNPTRQQPAHDNRIVDDHDPDASFANGSRFASRQDGTHELKTFGTTDTHTRTSFKANAKSGYSNEAVRSGRLPGTSPRQCPCRTAS